MSCPVIVPSLPAGFDMLQPALGTKVCFLIYLTSFYNIIRFIALLEDVTWSDRDLCNYRAYSVQSSSCDTAAVKCLVKKICGFVPVGADCTYSFSETFMSFLHPLATLRNIWASSILWQPFSGTFELPSSFGNPSEIFMGFFHPSVAIWTALVL